jgi:uncharacterized membrane protein YbhN (UPF0104 family)
VRRRHLAILGLVLVAGGCLAFAATGSGRADLEAAATVLRDAQPGWVLLAAFCCAGSLLCSARAWAVGLGVCGCESSFPQVAARYAVGSLVNAFAPAHLGAASRIALMARTLPCSDRLWQAGGVGVAVGVARSLGLALLVFAAAALGRIPVWPAPLLAALVAAAFLLGPRVAQHSHGRLGSVLSVFGRLGRREGRRLLAWICCATAVRVCAAAAAAEALGLAQPLWVAVVLLAAIALASTLPLTPGNFGVGAGAATLALHGVGVGMGQALALGVAFQAVETVASVTLGLLGTAVLATPGTPVRRLALAGALAAPALVAGALGMAAVDVV